jgi:outer membrane protein OmpA-like peptidoglycan-associated protein
VFASTAIDPLRKILAEQIVAQKNKNAPGEAGKRKRSQAQQDLLLNRYIAEASSLKADILRLQSQLSDMDNGNRATNSYVPVIIPAAEAKPVQIPAFVKTDTVYIIDTVVVTETIRSTDTLTLVKRDTITKSSTPVPSTVIIQRDTIVTQKAVDYSAIPADIILFDIGSAAIRPIYNKRLDYLASLLMNNNGLQALISGHTDKSGSQKINEALSVKRAENVAAYLTGKGVQPKQMVTSAVSWLEPAVSGNTRSANSQNRRVVIKLVKK